MMAAYIIMATQMTRLAGMLDMELMNILLDFIK
jgi:hypothetical protein